MANKKTKNKKSKRIRPSDLEKMPFEKREKVRKALRESAAYTKTFRTKQSFGAASEVRHIPVEQYLLEKEKEKISHK